MNNVMFLVNDPDDDQLKFASELSDGLYAFPIFAIMEKHTGQIVFRAIQGENEVFFDVEDLGEIFSVKIPGVGEVCFERGDTVQYAGNLSSSPFRQSVDKLKLSKERLAETDHKHFDPCGSTFRARYVYLVETKRVKKFVSILAKRRTNLHGENVVIIWGDMKELEALMEKHDIYLCGAGPDYFHKPVESNIPSFDK